jgi:antitoxin CptB
MTPPGAPSAPPPQGGAPSGPTEPDPRRPLGSDAPLQGAELSRLKWRCRRGLLENDLFIERFFLRHEAGLTVRHATGLQALMDLADNDLLDLLLARREPEGELARPEVTEVLGMLRARPGLHA